jgi:hypothetical protein
MALALSADKDTSPDQDFNMAAIAFAEDFSFSSFPNTVNGSVKGAKTASNSRPDLRYFLRHGASKM